MSNFIKGESRNQVQLFCLEQAVDKDNEVRLIDLFINSLALKDYGFRTEFEENGRPAYHPADKAKYLFASFKLWYLFFYNTA